MKINNIDFYLDLYIALEERNENIKPRLPNVTDAEFQEFCLTYVLLGNLGEFLK